MSTPGVPPWGWPWHGPVQSKKITLPNGQQRSYPTVSNVGARSGDTYLLKVPGTPAVERSADELAADTASGLQWWDKAILSSHDFRLYGKALAGWVYCDPAGDRWRVRGLTLQSPAGNSGSWPVTLDRFGDLAGSAETFNYTAALADLGQAAPALIASGNLRLTVRDIAPDGSKALLAITVVRSYTDSSGDWPANSFDRWSPAIGWLELSISGLGSAAAVALAVLHTRAQTIGTYDFVAGNFSRTHFYGVATTETTMAPGIVEWSPTVVEAASDEEREALGAPDSTGAILPGMQDCHERRTGIILACWYDSAGAIHRLTYDVAIDLHESAEEVAWVTTGVDRSESGVLVSQYTLSGSQSWQTTKRYSATLRLDSVALDVYEQEEIRIGSSYSERSTGYWSVINGVASAATADPSWGTLNGIAASAGMQDGQFIKLDSQPFIAAVGVANRRVVCPYELSNHCWALLVCRREGAGHSWTWRTTVAPGGALDNQTTTQTYSSGARLYGSWCPVTHQIARGTTSVFWV